MRDPVQKDDKIVSEVQLALTDNLQIRIIGMCERLLVHILYILANKVVKVLWILSGF